MPIETGLWRIDKQGELQGQGEALTKLTPAKFDDELRLERLLEQRLDVLGFDLLPIGRQVQTPSGKRADILAVDLEGELFVIELKRDRTPREAVAQLLDYGAWASKLTHEQVLAIYSYNHPDVAFEKAFTDRFGSEGGTPESLNQGHHLLLVASELDAASERIIGYCINYGIPVNAVFFKYFQDGTAEYLARSWLVNPEEAESKIKEGAKESWTGDYYVSFGDGATRNWDDAREFGFISAGGGAWYSRTLKLLQPGDRVLVAIPGRGYVGVGEVAGERVNATELQVDVNGTSVSLTQAPGLRSTNMADKAGDEERAEYAVPVKWAASVPRDKAHWEPGFFANQNTVCKLRNKFTHDRVLEHFKVAT